MNFANAVSRVRKLVARSPVLLALALLLSLNTLVGLTMPFLKADPSSMPSAHTWIYWATKDFLAQKTRPDVLLLGSSLLMFPLSRADADFAQKPLDYIDHHRSVYAEHALQEAGLKDAHCFNFGLPGGIMSDNYMVLRGLCQGAHKPRLIVLGLAMRDFMDNQISSAGASGNFRFMRRFTDIDDIVPLAMPQTLQRLDYCLDKACFLKRYKLDIEALSTQAVREPLIPLWQRLCLSSQLDKGKSNLPLLVFGGIVEPGHWVTKPHSEEFLDNNAEYKKRYRAAHKDLFEIERRFLTMTLDLAQRENIPCLLINMPVTTANTSYMPPGSYNDYLAMLDLAAHTYNQPFINLNGTPTYLPEDFTDTCHLSASGGRKLVAAIIRCIETDQRLGRALSDRVQVAGHDGPM